MGRSHFISYSDRLIDYCPYTKKFRVLKKHGDAYYWEKIMNNYTQAQEYILNQMETEKVLCRVAKVKGQYCHIPF